MVNFIKISAQLWYIRDSVMEVTSKDEKKPIRQILWEVNVIVAQNLP